MGSQGGKEIEHIPHSTTTDQRFCLPIYTVSYFIYQMLREQKIMHSEHTLAEAANDCGEQSDSENSTGVSRECSPLAAAPANATESSKF